MKGISVSKRTITRISILCTFIYMSYPLLKNAENYMRKSKINCSRYTGLQNLTSDPLFCARMQILFSRTCDRTTYDLRIIVIVFDRSQSLLRLLSSLNEAIYDGDKVKLEVWIDRSELGDLDKATVETANTFSFNHGVYEVIPHLEHVGLYGQWISTWRPDKNSSEMAVICEDDITVSKYFYKYLKTVHMKYDQFKNINGYALQGLTLKHHIKDKSTLNGPDGSVVFLYPVLGSWGFSPSRDNWIHFQEWYTSVCRNESLDLYIPNNKISTLYRKVKKMGKHNSIWTIWHIYHAYINAEFTLYTNIPGQRHIGLSANWREKGLHFHKYGGKTNELLQNWMEELENLPAAPKCVDIAGNIIEDFKLKK